MKAERPPRANAVGSIPPLPKILPRILPTPIFEAPAPPTEAPIWEPAGMPAVTPTDGTPELAAVEDAAAEAPAPPPPARAETPPRAKGSPATSICCQVQPLLYL